MTISKRDAMQLVDEIRRANVSGHAIVARTGGGHGSSVYGFLGGLEGVLRHFLLKQGCSEAAAALTGAMNDTPTDAEVAAHNEEIARWRGQGHGQRSSMNWLVPFIRAAVDGRTTIPHAWRRNVIDTGLRPGSRIVRHLSVRMGPSLRRFHIRGGGIA